MSSDEPSHSDVTGKAVLLLLAISLNALEAFIPRIPFLPWLKPGFANIITIIWVMRYGTIDALIFSFLRIWITGFYFGFSLITLSLGASGAITSTLVTGLLWTLLARRGWLGLFGVGVAGAVAHNTAQIIVVYLLMARNAYLFYQIPAMLAASLLLGGGMGLLAAYYNTRWINRRGAAHDAALPVIGPVPLPYTVFSLIIFGLCIAVMFEQSIWRLGIWSAAAMISVQIVLKWQPSALWRPLQRFWVLFLFVAFMYLFLSYGKRIPNLPFITYEGVHETACQWMRLWVWLQLSQMLGALRFNDVFMKVLTGVFPRRRSTIHSGVLALEHFPAVLDIGKSAGLKILRVIWSKDRRASLRELTDMYADVETVVTANTRGADRAPEQKPEHPLKR